MKNSRGAWAETGELGGEISGKTNMLKLVQRVCLMAGVLTLAASAAGPADLLVGTWKMNVAKSAVNPGPAPRSAVVTYTLEGDWLVSKAESINSDGTKSNRSNRVKMDGKEYPYEGPRGKGTLSMRRAGDRGYTTSSKFERGAQTNEYTISADGKTRTQVGTGTLDGKPSNSRIIWEKQ
jgi:hypothetical protein